MSSDLIDSLQILIPSNEYKHIHVFSDELPEDIEDILDALRSEVAPLSIWCQCAIEYYKQDNMRAFELVLLEILTAISNDKSILQTYKSHYGGNDNTLIENEVSEIVLLLASKHLNTLIEFKNSFKFPNPNPVVTDIDGEKSSNDLAIINDIKNSYKKHMETIENTYSMNEYTWIVKGYYDLINGNYSSALIFFNILKKKFQNMEQSYLNSINSNLLLNKNYINSLNFFSINSKFLFIYYIGQGLLQHNFYKNNYYSLKYFTAALRKQPTLPFNLRFAISYCNFLLNKLHDSENALQSAIKNEKGNLNHLILFYYLKNYETKFYSPQDPKLVSKRAKTRELIQDLVLLIQAASGASVENDYSVDIQRVFLSSSASSTISKLSLQNVTNPLVLNLLINYYYSIWNSIPIFHVDNIKENNSIEDEQAKNNDQTDKINANPLKILSNNSIEIIIEKKNAFLFVVNNSVKFKFFSPKKSFRIEEVLSNVHPLNSSFLIVQLTFAQPFSSTFLTKFIEYSGKDHLTLFSSIEVHNTNFIISICETILRKFRDTELTYILSEVYFYLGKIDLLFNLNFENAEKNFLLSEKINKNFVLPVYYLGILNFKKKNFTKSLQYFQATKTLIEKSYQKLIASGSTTSNTSTVVNEDEIVLPANSVTNLELSFKLVNDRDLNSYITLLTSMQNNEILPLAKLKEFNGFIYEYDLLILQAQYRVHSSPQEALKLYYEALRIFLLDYDALLFNQIPKQNKDKKSNNVGVRTDKIFYEVNYLIKNKLFNFSILNKTLIENISLLLFNLNETNYGSIYLKLACQLYSLQSNEITEDMKVLSLTNYPDLNINVQTDGLYFSSAEASKFLESSSKAPTYIDLFNEPEFEGYLYSWTECTFFCNQSTSDLSVFKVDNQFSDTLLSQSFSINEQIQINEYLWRVIEIKDDSNELVCRPFLGKILYNYEKLNKRSQNNDPYLKIYQKKSLNNFREDTITLFFNVACCFYKLNKFSSSKKLFLMILKYFPSYLECYYYLGKIAYVNNAYEESLEYFYFPYYYYSQDLLLNNNNEENNSKKTEEELRLLQLFYDIEYHLIDLLSLLGTNYSSLIKKKIEFLLKNNKSDTNLLLKQLNYYLLSPKNFNKFSQYPIGEKFNDINLSLLASPSEIDNLYDIKKLLTKLIKNNQNNLYVASALALFYAYQKNYQESSTIFLKIKSILEKQENLTFDFDAKLFLLEIETNLAHIYMKLGQYGDAERLYRNVVKTLHQDTSLLTSYNFMKFSTAFFNLSSNSSENTISSYTISPSTSSSSSNFTLSEIYEYLGICQVSTKNFTGARNSFNLALKYSINSPEIQAKLWLNFHLIADRHFFYLKKDFIDEIEKFLLIKEKHSKLVEENKKFFYDLKSKILILKNLSYFFKTSTKYLKYFNAVLLNNNLNDYILKKGWDSYFFSNSKDINDSQNKKIQKEAQQDPTFNAILKSLNNYLWIFTSSLASQSSPSDTNRKLLATPTLISTSVSSILNCYAYATSVVKSRLTSSEKKFSSLKNYLNYLISSEETKHKLELLNKSYNENLAASSKEVEPSQPISEPTSEPSPVENIPQVSTELEQATEQIENVEEAKPEEEENDDLFLGSDNDEEDNDDLFLGSEDEDEQEDDKDNEKENKEAEEDELKDIFGESDSEDDKKPKKRKPTTKKLQKNKKLRIESSDDELN